MQLRVIEQFPGYERGALITDAKAIEAVLASPQAQYVVKVEDPPPEQPVNDKK